MTRVIGWDLGGANVKAASVEDGGVVQVLQVPCPVLPDRSKFGAAVGTAVAMLPPADSHAVTMTGELSDVFANREEGVSHLIGLMEQRAAPLPLAVYAGGAGFLVAAEAKRRPLEVASANWHASAALVARTLVDGLLVDIGTTTTDLVPVRGGAVASRGKTDAERLTEGELVYTGVVRTPVIAVAQSAAFRGRSQGIAAERFATMADVWRLTGDLPEDADPFPTADLRGKSVGESAARLARMLGRDGADADPAEWGELASYFAACQREQLARAASRLTARESLPVGAPVVGAGCGRFLVRQIAGMIGRPYTDFATLIDAAPGAREMAARCAPAVAVALLASAVTESACASTG